MAKIGKTELPQTKSDFMLVGKLVGVKSDKFYSETLTKNGKSQRQVKFAVEYEDGKQIFVTFKGMVQDKVYFSRNENKEKGYTKENRVIDWEKRANFKEAGFQIMGTRVKLDEDDTSGTETKKAPTQALADYDACLLIATKLKELGDGTIIRVAGEFNRFTTKNKKTDETNNVLQLLGKKIFLSKVNDETDPLQNHYFHEQIVVNDIETIVGENGQNTKYLVNGYGCTYNTIEPLSLYTENNKLVNTFKKLLNKGYFSVRVYGDMRVEKEEEVVQLETVEQDDGWGESDVSLNSTSGFSRYELYIRGAEQESLDTETYTKQAIERAFELTNKEAIASEDYGEDDVIIESAEDVDLSAWD